MSLVIPHGKNLKEVQEIFPVGSYAVDEDRVYFVNNRWMETRKKPIYRVVQIWKESRFTPVGTHTAFGKIVKTFQAFNVEGNERAREQAEDCARKLNEEFYQRLAQKEARKAKSEERHALLIAQKNKHQTKLTSMWGC